jgi:hypothetical protein
MKSVILLLAFVACLNAGVVCPASGKPTTDCDASSNCFHHCCLTSGLCPSSSCVSSLDSPDDARANCENKCLDEVACVPFNPSCVPHDNQQHCIGTVSCKTANCDGRTAGSVCLYDGVSKNFKICDGTTLARCTETVTFNLSTSWQGVTSAQFASDYNAAALGVSFAACESAANAVCLVVSSDSAPNLDYALLFGSAVDGGVTVTGGNCE